jgi:hypothetical protein
MAFASSQTNFEPSATAESLWGDILRLGAAAEDVGLFYVDSAGAFAGSFGSSYKPASTDVLVKQYQNTGPLVLRYLKNNSGSTIDRAKCVRSIGPGTVAEATAAGSFEGVALCDVPDGQYAWFAIGGTAVAAQAGSYALGTPLTLAAAGELTTAGAPVAGTSVATVALGGVLGLVELHRGLSI